VNAALPPVQPGGGGGTPLPAPGGCSGVCAISWGDPHLTSFDGLSYDTQLAGEFVLARSLAGDLEVQVRQQPWGSSRVVAVNTAVVIGVVGSRIEIHAATSGSLITIDGQPVTDTGTIALGNGASAEISSDSRRITAIWPDGSFVATDYYGGSTPYLSMSLSVASDRAGKLFGLLGNGNGSQTDDLTTRAGEPLSIDPSARSTSVHGFADSWRISQDESLFTYGQGETTSTFTDLGFPYGFISVDALPDQQRTAALTACGSAGVEIQDFLNACVLDVAVTGDTEAATAAATAQKAASLVDGSALEVTPGLPAQSAPTTGYVFLDKTLTVSMPAGVRLVLSSEPDGTGDVYVDDRIQIEVTHEDGTTASFARGFEFQPPAPPLDLSSSMKPGLNTLRVQLMDTVGGAYSSTPLYLVLLDG
jgi:hypothetical protein